MAMGSDLEKGKEMGSGSDKVMDSEKDKGLCSEKDREKYSDRGLR